MLRIVGLLRWSLLALPLVCAAAHAQQAGLTGPTFAPTAINDERFDLVFDFVAPVWPLSPIFRNQPEDARFDAVVCNQDETHKGAVRVSGSNALGYLSPGECTMFVNFANLQFTRPEGEYEWKAKIYLRAHR